MAGIEDILGKHGNYHVRDKYDSFSPSEDSFFLLSIRGFLLPFLDPKILSSFSPFEICRFYSRDGKHVPEFIDFSLPQWMTHGESFKMAMRDADDPDRRFIRP